MSASGPAGGGAGWEVVVHPPGGRPARIVLAGGDVIVDPPDAADHPLVAAAAAEIARTLARPRARPACAGDPPGGRSAR
jgi:hypothetical protein